MGTIDLPALQVDIDGTVQQCAQLSKLEKLLQKKVSELAAQMARGSTTEHVDMCLYVGTSVCMRMCVRACVRACVQSCMRACVCAVVCACTCAFVL